MLLDQKRTRRIVQVVAILTSIAFVGVIFVVLGLVLVGGDTTDHGINADRVDSALEDVEERPNDSEAWKDLALAHQANESPEEAVTAARRAVELAPDDFGTTRTLVQLHLAQDDPNAAIEALDAFTKIQPDHADAFLQLGTTAEDAGRTQLARLSYQRYLTLNPDDPTADTVRERLEGLMESGSGG